LSTPEHHEVAGLLLQKAVEKALKAVLALRAIEIPRSHDLGYLVERLEGLEDELPQALLVSDWLTPWGVLFRYDDDPAVSLDRDRALEAATAAVGFAERVVGN
jgi:HEPN domain-containing protein